MTDNTEQTKIYDALFGPDKTRTRRVIIGVKVFDLVESRYGGGSKRL